MWVVTREVPFLLTTRLKRLADVIRLEGVGFLHFHISMGMKGLSEYSQSQVFEVEQADSCKRLLPRYHWKVYIRGLRGPHIRLVWIPFRFAMCSVPIYLPFQSFWRCKSLQSDIENHGQCKTGFLLPPNIRTVDHHLLVLSKWQIQFILAFSSLSLLYARLWGRSVTFA